MDQNILHEQIQIKKQIKFNKIAYFFSPQQGHLIPYQRLFDKLSQIYGLDAYVNKNFENHFTLQKANKILIKEFENFKMQNGFMKLCLEIANKSFDEIDQLWQMNNYLPKLIIVDMFGLVGKFLAIKNNIPFINLDSNFFYDNEQAYQFLKRDGYTKEWEQEIQKIVKPIEIKHNIKFQTLKEVDIPIFNRLCSSNYEFSILPSIFKINYLPSTMKQLGPIFDKNVPQNYIEEIKQIDKKGKNKIVYVAFGTIFNKNTKIIQLVLDALKEIQNVFVFASINDEIQNQLLIPDNVFHKSFWPSQIAILQQVDLFISHCGMGSFMEAVCCAVPVLGFPQGSEQFVIANKINELKIGSYFEFLPSNKEQITKVVLQILENIQYKSNIQQISQSINTDDNLKQYMIEIQKFF